MMIKKNSVVFVDDGGCEHICYKAGKKILVPITQHYQTLEEEFSSAVRGAACDSSIRPDDIKLIKNPNNDSYVLKTSSSFYFVKKRINYIEVIVDENSGMGFFAGLVGHYTLKAHSKEDLVVFWMIDKNTGEKVGKYNYFEW